MFFCVGHKKGDNGYVIFKVDDENIEKIQLLGKVLSHEGVSTNFENHYMFGRRVAFHSFKADSKEWIKKATQTIINPPENEVNPEIYYHEQMLETVEYKSSLQKFRDKIIDKLRQERFGNDEKIKEKNKTIEKQEIFCEELKEQTVKEEYVNTESIGKNSDNKKYNEEVEKNKHFKSIE